MNKIFHTANNIEHKPKIVKIWLSYTGTRLQGGKTSKKGYPGKAS